MKQLCFILIFASAALAQNQGPGRWCQRRALPGSLRTDLKSPSSPPSRILCSRLRRASTSRAVVGPSVFPIPTGKKPQRSIIIFEDIDGDGKFDKRRCLPTT